jgi:hypothetical protein
MAELALISFNPPNGRQPKFFSKWKMTSIFQANGRQLQFSRPMEDDINL